VKTVGFGESKYVGDPVNAVKIFNEKEADELIVLDIDASAEGREPNLRLISQIAVECRMPLCYGGGIRTVEHARAIINLGVEKISLSAGFVERPQVISEIAAEIGSQSVVVVLDAKKRRLRGGYTVHTRNGGNDMRQSPEELAERAQEFGAGEIVVNSIDQDGAMNGYDLDLASRMRDAVRVPLTVLGGAGSLGHIAELIKACGVVGAAAGSLFVFKGAYRAVLINYPGETQKEELIRSALSASAGA
jgi:cyclase